MEVHPLAELIPAMTPEEFSDLKADVEKNGLQVPITLYEGKVLDGRHRARACEELGVHAPVQHYRGDDPVRHVISLNVHRRHLTTAQKALIAKEALPHYREAAKERQAEGGAKGGRSEGSGRNAQSLPSTHKRARDEAAADVGISGRTVAQLERVEQDAPDLYERVRTGDMTVSAAEYELRERNGNPREHDSGLVTKTDKAGRKQAATHYGKGDKWQESTEPLTRYLKAWAGRDYEFAHVNPAEARRRLKRIDNLIAGLEAARTDLEPRSHKAKLTL